MLASDPGLRRVSVHADAAVVDLVLPARVPVAVLIPSIVDILHDADGFESTTGSRYQLSRPGGIPLGASTTLADNGIRDGDLLILSPPPAAVLAPPHDDAAQAVSATLTAAARAWGRPQTRLAGAVAATLLTGIGCVALIRNTLPRNGIHAAAVATAAGFVALICTVFAHRIHRDPIAGLALGLIATAFAAVAGILAVPGAIGMPHALLAAAAAAATSVVAMRASGCGAVTLSATSCSSSVIAVAALVGLIAAAPLHVVGSVSALVSLGLLGAAARVSIMLAGLSPRLPPEPDSDGVDPGPTDLAARAIRADHWLAGLLAAFSSSAAVGAVVTVLAGAPRPSCIAFGAVTGALLLLRSRGSDMRRALVFAVTGMAVVATTFGAAAAHARGPWLAAGTAAVAAVAMCVGFVAPAISLSPAARRGADLVESAVLAAMVPLTCWICGLYGAVRGLTLA